MRFRKPILVFIFLSICLCASALRVNIPYGSVDASSDERKTFPIDFMLDTSDGDKVYINEINTIPGSLAFYLWEKKGVPYRELIDRLIELAFSRKRRRDNLTFSIDTNILSGVSLGTKGAKGSKL